MKKFKSILDTIFEVSVSKRTLSKTNFNSVITVFKPTVTFRKKAEMT